LTEDSDIFVYCKKLLQGGRRDLIRLEKMKSNVKV
jgi:hypothetical protein